MKRILFLLPAASACIIGGSHLQGASLGGQISLVQPEGDLKERYLLNNKTGFGMGLHGFIDLGDGHALVPRLQGTRFKRDESTGYSIETRLWTLGADYQFHPGGVSGQGLYLLAGLGAARGSFHERFSGVNLSFSEHKTAPYLDAGAGYMFSKHIGAELRYQHIRFKDLSMPTTFAEKTDLDANSLQASIVLRF